MKQYFMAEEGVYYRVRFEHITHTNSIIHKSYNDKGCIQKVNISSVEIYTVSGHSLKFDGKEAERFDHEYDEWLDALGNGEQAMLIEKGNELVEEFKEEQSKQVLVNYAIKKLMSEGLVLDN